MVSVLVVDDEAGARAMLAMALRCSEVEVDTASDGLKALALIKERDYDWVISDIKMPGLDGIALSREIVSLRPETQVILISAVAGEEEMRGLPIAAFCCKPFDPLRLQMYILGKPQSSQDLPF